MSRVRRAVAIILHSAFGSSRRRSLLLLGLALAAIPVWQTTFTHRLQTLDRTYRMISARGIADQDLWAFFYFFRHLGLYPVAILEKPTDYRQAYPIATLRVPADDNEEGARRHLARDGGRLVMDSRWTFRSGERGKIFLYYPDALIRGTTRDPSVRAFHQMVFVGGLCALFLACWWIGQRFLGVTLVLLLGSNPFQLYEVYVNENIFGWSISTMIWALAIHLPLFAEDASPRYRWVAPFLTGVLVGTVGTIRPDTVFIVISAGATYLLVSGVRWRRRLALVGLLVVSLATVGAAWNAYFMVKFERARQVVSAAGGHPYPGPFTPAHRMWHAIWCGLGDFDRKYGYEYDDRGAYSYALPILREKYRVDVPVLQPGHYFLDAYWDEAKVYPKLPDELPYYEQVVRDKVLRDVVRDPLWYAGILARRIWRVLSDTTPVQIAIRPWRLTVPMHGVVFPLLLGVLIARRKWTLCKLLCFPLPLSLTAVAIHSGGGPTNYSCYHIFAAAVLLVALLQGAFRWWRWGKGRGEAQLDYA